MNYKELLKELNPLQIIEFKNNLRENFVDLISNKETSSKIVNSINGRKVCSHCNCNLWKNGHARNKIQKYICPSCKKTLTETTGTITYRSKKDFNLWKEIIDNLIDGLSIRRIAEKNKINKATSFCIIHKILTALSTHINSIILNGEIQADEKYISINLKGIKKDKMPRVSKKRTGSAYRGISHHKVCIATAIDEYDNLVMSVTGLGPITSEMVEHTFQNIIDKDATLVTDCKSSYESFCKKNMIKLEQIKSRTYQNQNLKNLSNVNNVHSQLELWLSKFKGVSTRHIQNYLNWFSYILMMKRKYEASQLETHMYRDIIVNENYLKSNDIFKQKFPIDLECAYGEYHFGIFAL